MKVFASDLDRTLIYSKRVIDSYETNGNYELIETLKGKPISYVSTKTKDMLKQLNKEMMFIPVTTRTVEQYQRISLFQNEIIPQYAIMSNGGTIMKDGVVVKEWSDFIQDKLSSGLPLSTIIGKIESLPNNQWIEKINEVKGLFLYLIIKRDKLPQAHLTYLQQWSMNHDIQMSLQGRKLYFIPKVVNKWKAVQFILTKYEIKETFSAGDSLLDYELVTNSDYGLAPAHGEILEQYSTIRQTKSAGIKASEEIIEAVQQRAFSKRIIK